MTHRSTPRSRAIAFFLIAGLVVAGSVGAVVVAITPGGADATPPHSEEHASPGRDVADAGSPDYGAMMRRDADGPTHPSEIDPTTAGISELVDELASDPPSGVRVVQSKSGGGRVTLITGTPDVGADGSIFAALQALIAAALRPTGSDGASVGGG